MALISDRRTLLAGCRQCWICQPLAHVHKPAAAKGFFASYLKVVCEIEIDIGNEELVCIKAQVAQAI